MADATRREGFGRPSPLPPRARTLRPTDPSTPAARRDTRPTMRPPPRLSALEDSEVRPYRAKADSGICLGEEVVADLSKDPRHDEG